MERWEFVDGRPGPDVGRWRVDGAFRVLGL
jgi:hypothetical protein